MKTKRTKESARLFRAHCNEMIYTTQYDFAKRVRAVVPGAPDKILEALAIYDPEAGRVIRFWQRKRNHCDRILGLRK
jgi:hypothetical protein